MGTCVMYDKVVQTGEKYDSTRYYNVICWSCIISVKGVINMCKTVVRGQLSIIVYSKS